MSDNNTYLYDRRSEIAELKRQRRRKRRKRAAAVFIVVLVIASLAVFFLRYNLPHKKVEMLGDVEIPEWIDSQIMPETGTSRRGEKLDDINAIVIHYVGNPGTTAQNNRDYYDNEGVTVNSHFIVGLDGEIIQCIPLDEKSSASNHRNRDTISIEVCHPDETGEFSDETYEALVKLASWLCEVCGLCERDIIRHYDVTGKLCPLYYVENEDAWDKLKKDIMAEAD